MAKLRFIKNFNNYYNRIIKYNIEDLDSYTSQSFDGINFDEQDGLYTEQVVNWTNDWTPDYMLLMDAYTSPTSFIEDFEQFQLITDNTHYFEDTEELAEAGLYDLETKNLNLSAIGEYDNQSYGNVRLNIEGDWDINSFSFKILPGNTSGITLTIWADESTITKSITSNTIINKQWLINNGWVVSENFVWGITLFAMSPDVFWGDLYCRDYTTTIRNAVKSSWFVLEWTKIRQNQYRAILKRDVIVDNYQQVISAPTYIEKGIIREKTNPLLYNSEGMAFNQIKQYETPIKDETNCGWVVGYIPSDWSGDTISSNVVVNSNQADITVNGLSNWAWWKNVTSNSSYKYLGSTTGDNKVGLKVRWNTQWFGGIDVDTDWNAEKVWFTTNGNYVSTDTLNYSDAYSQPSWWDDYHITVNVGNNESSIPSSRLQNMINVFNNSTFRGYVNAVIGTQIEVGNISDLLALRSKIIKDSSTNTYYRIDITSINSTNSITPTAGTTAGNNIINYVNNHIADANYWSKNGTVVADDISVQLASDAYAINLVQISVDCKVTINTDRYHLSDNPYDMFCIPYSDTLQIYDGQRTFTCIKDVALNIAEAIAKEAGSGSIYDIQLLPYCPARHVIAGSANPSAVLDVSRSKYNHIVTTSTDPDTNTETITGYVSTIIWCMSSTFTFDKNMPLELTGDTVDAKISNECDLFRLSSGNFNGMFEFSLAKAYGYIQGYKIECTYKPFNPYIHITPKLSGLYGANYNTIDDMRGLICGGDFSLPQLSNTWANYELANKNYQQIFDRQMQNLDVQYDVANQEALIGAITGTITGTTSGAVSGALTGSKLGGGYGAIAGAAIGGTLGGAASLAGGITDYRNVKRLQEENRSFQTDLFNYNLQNIQAIPSSLAKTSALTFNTRVWPFLEYYTCTEREKQILRDKIKYNGMTVMAIDTISNYITDDERSFVQGRIIKLENVNGESAMVAEINNELSKGVYI